MGWQRAVTLEDVKPETEVGQGHDERPSEVSVAFGPVADGTCYAGIGSMLWSKVVALDPTGGDLLWQRQGYTDVAAADEERVFCYREGDLFGNELVALGADEGEERWLVDFDGLRTGRGAEVDGDVLYVPFVDVEDDDLTVVLRAFDATAGTVLGERSLPSDRSTAPVVGDDVFLGTGIERTVDGDHVEKGCGVHGLDGVGDGGEW